MGDSIGCTHIKSAKKWLSEALRQHRHLVLLSNPKADTHFAVRWRVAGRVGTDTAGKGAAARASIP